MLSCFGKGLVRRKLVLDVRYGIGAHQIPSLALDRFEFLFTYDSENTFRGAGCRMEFEVQSEDIGRAIVEIVETKKELVDGLERVVTRSESEYCV